MKMLGQMIISGFRGTNLTQHSPIIKDLETYDIGGVILYDEDVADPNLDSRNIASPEQVTQLVQYLKSINDNSLIIGIDQEGGEVQRLRTKYGFPDCPSWGSVGTINDQDATRDFSTSIAETLSGLGINLNFAPVLDLDINPLAFVPREGRCFSSNPEMVAEHARIFVDEHMSRNIIPVLKHFPGLGSAAADTHEGFTDISDTWSETELIPYTSLLSTADIPVIMVGHCFNKNLDPDWPASMSHNIITGLLRKELGFEGIVVCDDPMMGAIAKHFPFDVVMEKMINAGVDLFCFGNNLVHDPDIVPRFIKTIESLIASGKITEDRIQESLNRIAALKENMS